MIEIINMTSEEAENYNKMLKNISVAVRKVYFSQDYDWEFIKDNLNNNNLSIKEKIYDLLLCYEHCQVTKKRFIQYLEEWNLI